MVARLWPTNSIIIMIHDIVWSTVYMHDSEGGTHRWFGMYYVIMVEECLEWCVVEEPDTGYFVYSPLLCGCYGIQVCICDGIMRSLLVGLMSIYLRVNIHTVLEANNMFIASKETMS